MGKEKAETPYFRCGSLHSGLTALRCAVPYHHIKCEREDQFRGPIWERDVDRDIWVDKRDWKGVRAVVQ